MLMNIFAAGFVCTCLLVSSCDVCYSRFHPDHDDDNNVANDDTDDTDDTDFTNDDTDDTDFTNDDTDDILPIMMILMIFYQ